MACSVKVTYQYFSDPRQVNLKISHRMPSNPTVPGMTCRDWPNPSYLAGMSPYISLKIKKRHYEHHMIEAHKYLITWISDDIFFKHSG